MQTNEELQEEIDRVKGELSRLCMQLSDRLRRVAVRLQESGSAGDRAVSHVGELEDSTSRRINTLSIRLGLLVEIRDGKL